ncbi:BhlA/UviB family holin-like peptide [Clostridium septicum]|uniref:BhlA/UviB family holin-like peptide n=2 Tax=Clostridium TaxID=1485 RepID=UPI0036F47D99
MKRICSFYLKKSRCEMENELFKVIATNGAWAILFVWLLIDTRKESKAREERLQSIIDKNQEVIGELAEKFDVVENIQDDVKDIKIKLDKVG